MTGQEVCLDKTKDMKFLKGKKIVIKYGGSIMENQEARDAFVLDIKEAVDAGAMITIVHGGGPEISQWIKKAGMTPEFVKGLRVTDSKVIEIAEMVLSGKVNKELSGELSRAGVKALGLSGRDSNILSAEKKYIYENDQKIDIGYVGEITSVNGGMVEGLMKESIVPVISPISQDGEGVTLNTNADTAAAAIGGEIKADMLLILTDVEGVYLQYGKPETLLKEVKAEEIEGLEKSGVITGGMIPKLHCCREAVNMGTNSVRLVDGRKPHCLIGALRGGPGTVIHK